MTNRPTASATERVIITAPGVYDIPTTDYHADPIPDGSLTSSGARKLLPPSCPALYRHWLDEGDTPTAKMELGSAAHHLVLGVGPQLVEVEATDWRSKSAQQQAKKIRDNGGIPLLSHQLEQVQEMAAALDEHPLAAQLLDPALGHVEQTLAWHDEEFGVWRRALLDYLPILDRRRPLIIPDYKTCDSAAPEDLQRAIQRYGYHQQADWYLAGAQALGLPTSEPPMFVFVFQETRKPYLVSVVEPDREALEIAHVRNRKALDVYRSCRASGRWPGYGDEVIRLGLPAWAVYQHADAEQAGDFDIEEK